MKLASPLISAPVTRFWVRWRFSLIPIAVLLCLTLPHFSQGDWRGDTGWYGAIGVQAWRTGNFLSLESQPGVLYFNKPPLALWIHGLFLDFLGINLAAARVPTVLAAAVGVLTTGAIARRLGGRRVALWSGLALASSYEFFRRTREISLDMWQLAFVMIAVWALVGAVRDRDRGRSAWRSLAAGAAIGAALLCKPLVALPCVPMLGVWSFWVASRRSPASSGAAVAAAPSITRSIGLLFTMLAAAVLAAGPWHLAMIFKHGAAFLNQYFGAEVMDRAAGVAMGGQVGHQPVWFYGAQILTGHWPWLIAVFLGLVVMFRGAPSRARSLGLLGLVFFVGWFVLLTAFPDRRDRYALPLYPALAWLSAIGVCGLRGEGARRFARAVTRAVVRWSVPVVVLIAGLVAVLPVRLQSPPNPQWAALFAWLKENPGQPIWDGAVSGAPAARVYLETGEWPRATRGSGGRSLGEPAVGDLLVYHARGGRKPGTNENSVFQAGDLTITRLEVGVWDPETIGDPGER